MPGGYKCEMMMLEPALSHLGYGSRRIELSIYFNGISGLPADSPIFSMHLNPNENKTMTNYIYARVSCDDQNVEQQAADLASKHKYDYMITEKFTGSTIDRPEFSKLIAKLVSGDRLIVREISRIGRTTVEVLKLAQDLNDRGVSLVIDNLGIDVTTSAGEMVLTVLAGAAKMEKDLMLERQRIGIERAKSEGKYKGRKVMDPAAVKTAKDYIANGMKKADAAKRMKIGVSTLYRYLAA